VTANDYSVTDGSVAGCDEMHCLLGDDDYLVDDVGNVLFILATFHWRYPEYSYLLL